MDGRGHLVSRDFYERLLFFSMQGKQLYSVMFISGERTGRAWLSDGQDVLWGSLGDGLDACLISLLNRVDRRRRAVLSDFPWEGRREKIFIEYHEPTPSLLIVGAGHISRAMSSMAHELGFELKIYDDRRAFLDRDSFPEGAELILGQWVDVAEKARVSSSDYAVIVTHAHVGDLDALISLAGRDLAYLGMIGSRRKVGTLMSRAAEAGIPEEKLERVFSPIGLSIGAETPEEIAISILAEIVAVSRGADPSCASSCSLSGRKA